MIDKHKLSAIDEHLQDIHSIITKSKQNNALWKENMMKAEPYRALRNNIVSRLAAINKILESVV